MIMSKITFTCSECQAKGEVESNDFETQTESDEAGMGTQTEYWTEIETECQNGECGNSIEITLHQTEYPQGDFQELTVNTSSGAENISIH
jgi:DNA replicative helicase MCM subunit Mcm2 (Cdc46/Mcm family)